MFNTLNDTWELTFSFINLALLLYLFFNSCCSSNILLLLADLSDNSLNLLLIVYKFSVLALVNYVGVFIMLIFFSRLTISLICLIFLLISFWCLFFILFLHILAYSIAFSHIDYLFKYLFETWPNLGVWLFDFNILFYINWSESS